MKQKLLSILALLLMAVTGAWADTTVTWTASDMSSIYIDFWDGEAYNNTIKGITVTSSGGGGGGDGWERTYINLYGGSTTITFTSSVGKIKSIAITAEDIMMSSTPSGWTTDYSKLSWSGSASSTVSLPLSGGTDISDISGIVFTIESSTVNVTANEGAPGEYWATYYNATQGFTADANTTVFKAALTGSQLTMTEVANREIPAGKAVILKSTSSSITLTPATTTETLEGNQLQGTATAITNPGNAYVLSKGAKGVGFYKLTSGGTIGANKAYLTYSAGARDFFLFDETTGIISVNGSGLMVNGSDGCYDLQGRRVAQPTKGLYIVNGKKVFINK